MRNKDIEMLSAIVRSPIFAPSVSAMAQTLGYPSRSTLYRVIDGTAGDSAVYGLLRRLIKTFELSEDDIGRMYEVIKREKDLEDCLANEFKSSPERRRSRDIVVAFVTHNRNAFSESFRRGALTELMRFELERPDMFYSVLSYFYIKESGEKAYNPRYDFIERVCEIIKTIGEELMEIYMENDAAIAVLDHISRPKFYDSFPRVLGAFINPLGFMLRFFARPGDAYQSVGEVIMPEILAERTYWRGTDEGRSLLLLQPFAGPKPGSGRYELYKIDASTAKAEFVGRVVFIDDNTLALNIHSGMGCVYGNYRLDTEEFNIEWDKQGYDPTGAGNRWTRLDPRCSQILRSLDRRLTTEQLERVYMMTYGADIVHGYEIEDVMITRRQVRLCLRNGSTYSIDLDEYDFLRGLLPSEPVRIIKTLDDGEMFVHWPRIMICVPLAKFTEVD